ncbi:MAG: four helix bundle protein [Candidatus Cloacimonadota bacterium]|nr:MAG: four helix bundle protein [Candidatus Cloacimonadota bacterium]
MTKKKGKIFTFEDLKVYIMAREFSRKISKLIKKLPEEEEYNLKHQMRKAKLSVTNNIAEGYGRYHYQENIQFCRMSRGSICEIIDDINECYDEGYIDENYRDDLKRDAYELIRVLNGYIASNKRQKDKQKSSFKNEIIT